MSHSMQTISSRVPSLTFAQRDRQRQVQRQFVQQTEGYLDARVSAPLTDSVKNFCRLSAATRSLRWREAAQRSCDSDLR